MRGKVLITGGAGYIGSMLAGVLLQRGYDVVVLDDLLFGGESLLPYFSFPGFCFAKRNVAENNIQEYFRGVKAVVHLAAIVGFPACQQVGREVARLYNVEATKNVFSAGEAAGVERFIFASSYSNYGVAQDGKPVTEDSPLYPQSLYAETKIDAEQYLLERSTTSNCAPLIFRFATLFGISPRTRFDLIVNQFVLEALTRRQLIIYQRGYSRSFVHVRDVVQGLGLAIEAPEDKVRGQVYNLGSDAGNYTKDEIIHLVKKHVDGLTVTYKELSFGGDMRDIAVSFAKVQRELGFVPQLSVEQGVIEVRDAIRSGLVKDPMDNRYRNAHFIVQ